MSRERAKGKDEGVLVVDNGTYECRAGRLGGEPAISVRNQILRIKDRSGRVKYLLGVERKKDTARGVTVTQKTMFDGPVVYNYEVLEGTLDSIMEETGITMEQGIILTECFMNPRFFRRQALSLLFDVYSCPRVQLGYDFVYSYEYNLEHNKDLSREEMPGEKACDVIISLGHLGVVVAPVEIREVGGRKRILYDYVGYLGYGGLPAQTVFYETVQAKYYGTGVRIAREDTDEAFRRIRVAEDYFKEAEDVVYSGTGNIVVPQKKYHAYLSREKKPLRKLRPPMAKRQKKPKAAQAEDETEAEEQEETAEEQEQEQEQGTNAQVAGEEDQSNDYAEINKTMGGTGDSAREAEDDPAKMKMARRERLIKGAQEHRTKQKILKLLDRLAEHIRAIESLHYMKTDPEGYTEDQRKRLEDLQRILRKRASVRNELRTKKSKHSLALLKKSISGESSSVKMTEEEERLLEEINESQQDDIDILTEIDHIDGLLRERDPSYAPQEENIVDRIRHGYGKEKGGVNINIELIRTPEVLFNPSIVGIEQPGIVESLFRIFQGGFAVRNVFLTGGFSRIEGLEARLRKEVLPLSYLPQYPRIIAAKDCVKDAFRGCSFSSKFFLTHTLQEYREKRDELFGEE